MGVCFWSRKLRQITPVGNHSHKKQGVKPLEECASAPVSFELQDPKGPGEESVVPTSLSMKHGHEGINRLDIHYVVHSDVTSYCG